MLVHQVWDDAYREHPGRSRLPALPGHRVVAL